MKYKVELPVMGRSIAFMESCRPPKENFQVIVFMSHFCRLFCRACAITFPLLGNRAYREEVTGYPGKR